MSKQKKKFPPPPRFPPLDVELLGDAGAAFEDDGAREPGKESHAHPDDPFQDHNAHPLAIRAAVALAPDEEDAPDEEESEGDEDAPKE